MEHDDHLDTSNTTVNDIDSVKKTHTGEKVLCDETFTKQGPIQGNLTEYSCEICMKTFSCEKEVFTHKEMHNRNKSSKCKICGKAFVFNSKLRRHERRHGRKAVSLWNL